MFSQMQSQVQSFEDEGFAMKFKTWMYAQTSYVAQGFSLET